MLIDMSKPVMCQTCGNALEPDEVLIDDRGKYYGICGGCRHVRHDYEFINDFDELAQDEEHSYNCTCETCIQNYPERRIFLEEFFWD